MDKLEDVAEFHAKMGFYPHTDDVDDLFEKVKEKRKAILSEEVGELIEAIDSDDPVAILHEGIDVLYVTLGALHELGITQAQLDVAWSMVQEANMAKRPPDGPLEKAKKGDRWKKADVSKALSVKSKLRTCLVSYAYPDNGSWAFSHIIVDAEGSLTKGRAEQMLGLIRSQHEGAVISNIVELEG